MMTFQIISYSLTLKSVVNPSSIVPLTYSVSTMIKSTINCLSTTTYAISNAFALNSSYSKNNNTYGQATNLTITIDQNYYPFDTLVLYISKSIFVFENILENTYNLA
jgi:hypothetical protein